MTREGVILLISEGDESHGVHDAVKETVREVFCEVKSVRRSEFYGAMAIGVEPELVFKVFVREEYQGERLLRFENQRYEIIRTFDTDDGGVELTVKKEDAR